MGKEHKSSEDRQGMLGVAGKLFFYKIEEVLVTRSAGQCAGARVCHGACSLMSRDQRRQTWKLLKYFPQNFSPKTN